jgi:histidyl-tRNA synthetase
MSTKKPAPKKIKAPKGTRDLYPEDVLRQQYITNAWRDAALRCGFDEIAGPTFETTELYSVKSGEGILGELFQAFSGKSPKEVERVKETGQAEFALRPEFTPTLARMYAAKAKELPQPCKWFTAGPYFRAERPQRGRLREFLQWNVDVLADDQTPTGRAQADAECIGCAISLFESLGLKPSDVNVHVSDRSKLDDMLVGEGVSRERLPEIHQHLDKAQKMPEEKWQEQAELLGIPPYIGMLFKGIWSMNGDLNQATDEMTQGTFAVLERVRVIAESITNPMYEQGMSREWCKASFAVVRGLAYYTGTVFEALADGERAVAGGGRYDNLIELFGGPPTPACGFGMGDVVLGNLLDDKGLMPSGSELMDAVARPQASIRPVAFVVPNGDEDNEALVHTLVANLRRGIESDDWKARDERKPWDRDRYSVAPMHARVSYKSTRNLKKLRADAVNQHARFFVEIHADNKVELTDLDHREPITSDTHGSFSIDPSAENYVGLAIATRV